ncbi:hypothetical protein GCM10007939_01880 [Amylibacter marinus]|uniref:Ferrochelatase n=1 Tax=Amylibacter marinus TaxID=1475483 RepID=A0ABQ5VR68_9RHOB|nr:hypothetical protein [Amylibacter marinus]GLQ33905.1 hypothetical protein GCM10007939_01880 [Amylibacter marinus]
MKNLLLSLSIVALSVTATQAGTLTDPAVEEIIEPAAEGSSANGILIPLLILGVAIALVASSDDDDDNCNIYRDVALDDRIICQKR